MTHPVPTKGLQLSKEAAMLSEPSVEIRPPPLFRPFCWPRT